MKKMNNKSVIKLFSPNFLGMISAMSLLAFAQGAWAQNPEIKYIERSWNGTSVVENERTITNYTVLEGEPGNWKGLENGQYYVVKGNVEYKTLNVLGRSYLILCDGAKLTCTGGILIDTRDGLYNVSLTIYSQGDGDNMGKLYVTNSYSEAAGIGSPDCHPKYDYHAAQFSYCGKIEIHGGDIEAYGADYAAGIGSGLRFEGQYSAAENKNSLLFTMYGGKVYAKGGKCGAGIGGGYRFAAGTVKVYGGELTAQGGKYAAGIGSGDGSELNNGAVHIYAGTVTARGGDYGAGIGGGQHTPGGLTYIYGGTVNAYGGEDGAGIGGGEDGEGGETHISGGTVRAEGKSYGSGIGGGEDVYMFNYNGYGGNTYITGGIVTAIAGGDCECRDAKCGSAIGCGDGVGDKDCDERARILEIADHMMVTGGDSETDIERVFTAAERVPACRWRNYVRIEPCQHTTPTVGSDRTEPFDYSVDDQESHTSHCRYCMTPMDECPNLTLKPFLLSSSCDSMSDNGNTETGINEITDPSNPSLPSDATNGSNPHIYSLGGHRNSSLHPGLNIVVLDDGTVKKIFVK